jgi:hypothetical protein
MSLFRAKSLKIAHNKTALAAKVVNIFGNRFLFYFIKESNNNT